MVEVGLGSLNSTEVTRNPPKRQRVLSACGSGAPQAKRGRRPELVHAWPELAGALPKSMESFTMGMARRAQKDRPGGYQGG
jgi:hypothetical protein